MAAIYSRNKGRGCPRCAIRRRSNRTRVKKGINDFETWCADNGRNDLLKEWDIEKNRLLPSEVAYGSHKVFFWTCSKCHLSFESNVPNRRFGNDCPYCSNQKVMTGFNDFETYCKREGKEYLLHEWDYIKNVVKPNQVSKGTGKKFWWVCKMCKYSYESSISHRLAGRSCPYCKDDGRKKVCPGFNDFETFCKKNDATVLLEEWDYEKNDCLPSEITFGSTKMIWWKCLRCNNSFQLLPSTRRRGGGCPKCSQFIRTSFREQAIFYYVSKHYPKTISRYTKEDIELDIYVPERRMAIEYDGQEWHKNIERDLKKIDMCKQKGIELVNVREPKCPNLDITDNSIYILSDMSDKEFERVLTVMLREKLNIVCSINLNEDRFRIYGLYMNTTYNRSVAYVYPELVKEWDMKGNNGIGPERFSAGTSIRVSWICTKCGRLYIKTPSLRAKGSGCPYCKNRKIVEGMNDLATLKPNVAKEWNYEKNGSDK